MKLRIAAFAIICVFTAIFQSAYALGSGTSARGNIHIKNGERLDSVRFEMPLNQDTRVKVTVDGAKRKIEAGEYDFTDFGYKSVDIYRIIDDYNPTK